MEYHDQPLQFINNHYFQAKHLVHGVYHNITTLIFAMSQYPLFSVPHIGFLTFSYAYPIMFNYLEYYSMNQDNPDSAKAILFLSLTLTSISINVGLILAHVFSTYELIIYGNEVLNDEDHYMPYLQAGCSAFGIVTMVVFCSWIFLLQSSETSWATKVYYYIHCSIFFNKHYLHTVLLLSVHATGFHFRTPGNIYNLFLHYNFHFWFLPFIVYVNS